MILWWPEWQLWVIITTTTGKWKFLSQSLCLFLNDLVKFSYWVRGSIGYLLSCFVGSLIWRSIYQFITLCLARCRFDATPSNMVLPIHGSVQTRQKARAIRERNSFGVTWVHRSRCEDPDSQSDVVVDPPGPWYPRRSTDKGNSGARDGWGYHPYHAMRRCLIVSIPFCGEEIALIGIAQCCIIVWWFYYVHQLLRRSCDDNITMIAVSDCNIALNLWLNYFHWSSCYSSDCRWAGRVHDDVVIELL